MHRKPIFLLMSSFFKGGTLIEECKALGIHTILLTVEKLKDKPWPWHAIDEKFFMPENFDQPGITHAVSFLARTREIDRIIPLDDFDVEVAAGLREHLRSPGMGDTTARFFRDKLAMRVQARDEGVPVPDFVHVLNYQQVNEFLERVPGPWVLKPRSQAGSIGIKKCENSQEVWEHINRLGDEQSEHLIEKYVPGDVFHVDSVVYDHKVLFALSSRYHKPPFDVWNRGGVFATQTVDPKHPAYHGLLEANEQVIKAMRLVRGVTHAEFIRSQDGQIYFLEMAARVGGAHIDRLVEAASGLNPWREWARLELAYLNKQKYKLPKIQKKQAGLVICLSKDESPDLSHYNAPEIVWKLAEEHHAAVIVADAKSDKVDKLLDEYSERLTRDVLAVAPPTETAVH
jgi:biotin carboxylase